MQRQLWINKDLNSYYPCPHCNQGALALIDYEEDQSPQSIKEDEEARNEGWGPRARIQSYYFRAGLFCNMCKEKVHCIGEYWASCYGEDEADYPSLKERLQPKYFLPSLKLINIPYSTPIRLKQEITNSYDLFWLNESACANSIRKVLELLMDEENIPKISKKGSYVPLQQRLEQFDKVNKMLLSAVKEIGNAGSHSKTTVDIVLDGYELLEHILELLYSDRQGDYLKLAETTVKKLKGNS